jgi:hypothetical protein
MNPAAAQQHHTHPAPGPGSQIFNELIRDMTVVIHSEVDAHGRHEQPVFHRHVANGNGIKKMGQHVFNNIPPYSVEFKRIL